MLQLICLLIKMSERKYFPLFSGQMSAKKVVKTEKENRKSNDEIMFISTSTKTATTTTTTAAAKPDKPEPQQAPKETANESLEAFTYTQEDNDSSLNFSSDEEDNLLFNTNELDSVRLDTAKPDTKPFAFNNNNNNNNDYDDDDDDEDIKLIYDSKELLEKIDGKLKSVCIDLLSDEDNSNGEWKVLPKEVLNNKKSPIVINRNKDVVKKQVLQADDGFSPIVLSSKTASKSKTFVNTLPAAKKATQADSFVFKVNTNLSGW